MAEEPTPSCAIHVLSGDGRGGGGVKQLMLELQRQQTELQRQQTELAQLVRQFGDRVCDD